MGNALSISVLCPTWSMGIIVKKIYMAGIKQESNSFNPLKSEYGDFRVIRGQQIIDEVAGVKELIDAGYEVVTSIYANAVPGGTLKLDSFLRLVDEMLEPLPRDGSIDGVFLPMHGALDVESIGCAESYIASRIREIVGINVPISVPLDMHANNTYSLIDTCNIIYGYRTAPHIDVRETHIRAAELLIKALEENKLPRTRIVRIPVVMPGENMMPVSGIGKEVIEFLPEIEKMEGVWCASYFVGMVWVDCPQNGAAVIISGDGEMCGGVEKSKELARLVWDNKHKFEYQGLAMEPDKALEYAVSRDVGPVLISDSADNVTAGAAGDNALFLNKLIKGNVTNALVAAIIDPPAVESCAKEKAGAVIDITVGGAFDTDSEKAELKGAEIRNVVSDKETGEPKSAVLRYKGIDILLLSKRLPVRDEEALNQAGLSLFDYKITVVKQGYLTPYLSEASKYSVMALTPGNCNQIVKDIKFMKLRQPMFPVESESSIPESRLFETH